MKEISVAEKRIKTAYQLANTLALEHVEYLARTILQQHKNLDEFVMAMGTWYFTKRVNNAAGFEILDQDSTRYLENSRLRAFIDVWDQCLKLTGQPMRFTAEGPVQTDW